VYERGAIVIGLNWVMLLPEGLSVERFEAWYLGVHTQYVESALGVKRYTINRALSAQPDVAEGKVFRVAQEYWGDWETMEKCWNSASGHVLLGDGLVNMGLGTGTIAGVAVTEDTRLAVADPARFSTISGGYPGHEDGTITKWLAYGLAEDGADRIGGWYRDRFGGLGQDSRVREHVFGTGVGRRVQVGYLASIPGPEQHAYDWLLELWFDSNADANAFLGSEGFLAMWEELGSVTNDRVAALFRGQERVMISAPLEHRDE
jgi:hypothetical protein